MKLYKFAATTIILALCTIHCNSAPSTLATNQTPNNAAQASNDQLIDTELTQLDTIGVALPSFALLTDANFEQQLSQLEMELNS